MSKLSLIKEFYLFAKKNGKWWIFPLFVMLVLFGALIVFAEGSALAPFIYTLF